MFTAQLSCESCSFRTADFVVGLVPSRNAIDLVFQDLQSHECRIATCDEICSSDTELKALSATTIEGEHAWRIKKKELVAANIRQGEVEIEIWRACGDDSMRMICPTCRQTSVRVELLAVL